MTVSETIMESIAAMSSSSRAIKKITQYYLDKYDSDKHPSPEQVENDLLKQISHVVLLHNKCAESGEEWEPPKSLHWYTIVDILLKFHAKSVANMEDKVSDNVKIKTIVYSYNNTICSDDVKEIIKRVKDAVLLDNKGDALNEKDMRVRKFKQEVLEKTSLECLPTKLLFAMYVGWHDNNYPDQKKERYGKNLFLDSIKRQTDPNKDGWAYFDANQRVRGRMNYFEPLLLEYHCTEFMKNSKSKNQLNQMTIKKVPELARGLFKLNSLSEQKRTGRKSKRK